MQSLSVISVNVWQIIISLCNLLILTFIVKKFLFKRIKKVFQQRRDAIDKDYSDAKEAREQAEEARMNYEAALAGAQQAGEQIISDASRSAERRSNEIILQARERADQICRQAETEARLEKKKAEAEIRREITDVSAELTGKLLEREINADDHRNLIDSFLQDIGSDT
ncbi:MAG: ATP synthase F0 subunit B [Clostridiales bacterium]|nr:ATP synthase F0 subunit B [Clostridiales bacterium]